MYSAVAAARCWRPHFPDVGIGLLGVSLAFGLTVLSGAYALGSISGGHFNPAVSVGMWAGGRFPAALLVPYIAVQVADALLGAGVRDPGKLRETFRSSSRRVKLTSPAPTSSVAIRNPEGHHESAAQ